MHDSYRLGTRATWRILMLSIVVVGAMAVTARPAQALDGETFSITEIDFEAGTIEVTNHGESDVDPNGLIVCNFPAYAPIEGAPTLAPGESYIVNLGALSIPADAADGEMGLYLDSNFESADSIVAYVEWGSDGHERSPVAQAAESGGATLWDGSPVEGGASALQAAVDFPTSGSDWSAVASAQEDSAETLPFTGIATEAIVALGIGLLAIGTALVIADRRPLSR